ncbi:hypothetical protein QE386_000566 [Pseudoxanthomonas winnipegensis]|nr:hypothetical protein [Pseudoxanthomonas winnipegensis]
MTSLPRLATSTWPALSVYLSSALPLPSVSPLSTVSPLASSTRSCAPPVALPSASEAVWTNSVSL